MDFSRSDQRRRRVLYDEAVQQSASAGAPEGEGDPSTPKRRRANNYHSNRCQRLKVSELAPTHWLTMTSIVVGSVAVITGLNVLSRLVAPGESPSPTGLAQALSLAGPASLASWFCTVSLCAAALVAIQVYSLRRFRRDDYRGTYRVWIILAALFLLGSLQHFVRIDLVAGDAIAATERTGGWNAGGAGWILLRAGLVLLVFGRLLIEIRHCRLAVVLASIGLIGFGIESLRAIGGVVPDSIVWSRTCENAKLVGCAGLLNAVLAYARYVALDAAGRLQRRGKPKRRRTKSGRRARPNRTQSRSKQTNSERRNRTAATASTSPTEPEPASRSGSSGPLQARLDALRQREKPRTEDSTSSSDTDSERRSGRPLSKAERRRLKKLQRRSAA